MPNPCGESNGNCSHLCLLSSTLPEGYSCGCPAGLINTENQYLCECKPYTLQKKCLFLYILQPHHTCCSLTTLEAIISSSGPDLMEQREIPSTLVAVPVLYLMISGSLLSLLLCWFHSLWSYCRRNYLFWMDINSDRLFRSWLNGSQVTTLISSGIQCSGNHAQAFVIHY